MQVIQEFINKSGRKISKGIEACLNFVVSWRGRQMIESGRIHGAECEDFWPSTISHWFPTKGA